MALADDDSGWTPVDDGYRCEVEGGYVVYRTDERTLEMVAVAETEIDVAGQVTEVLEGHVRTTLTSTADGRYYDDEWGGWTEERARDQADTAAERRLDVDERQAVRQARDGAEAEAEAAPEVEARARQDGEERYAAAQAAEQPALEAEARRHLEAVGLRCRQAFHQVLSRAYREAILAYARRNSAEGVSCDESGDTLEIEFHIRQ